MTYTIQNFVEENFLANQTILVEYLTYNNAHDIICDANNILEGEGDDEYPKQILEWILVTPCTEHTLRRHKEATINSPLGTWWGRTTSGQAIYLDGIINKIWEE